jgi:hypothetical protein
MTQRWEHRGHGDSGDENYARCRITRLHKWTTESPRAELVKRDVEMQEVKSAQTEVEA